MTRNDAIDCLRRVNFLSSSVVTFWIVFFDEATHTNRLVTGKIMRTLVVFDEATDTDSGDKTKIRPSVRLSVRLSVHNTERRYCRERS